jgi:hypothetical protein
MPGRQMTAIGGLVFVLACVFGSYIASGGSMGPLMEAIPFEMLTIVGAAIGTFVLSNSMHDVKHTLNGLGKAMKAAISKKADYAELLSLPYFLCGSRVPRVRWRWRRISKSRRRASRFRNSPRSCRTTTPAQ